MAQFSLHVLDGGPIAIDLLHREGGNLGELHIYLPSKVITGDFACSVAIN